MNDYDEACDRMDRARAQCQHAKREAERIVRAADEEWTAADENLTRFERAPGLPLPQHRPEYHEHWRPGGPLVKHCHAAGRTPHEHARER